MKTLHILFLIAFNYFWFCVSLPILAQYEVKASLLEPAKLQVNNLEFPVISASEVPRFSWSYAIPQENFYGLRQVAYQILVATSEKQLNQNIGDSWNSGKVSGSQQLNIIYRGNRLSAQKKYYWKIRVWDQHGNPSNWSQISSFTTGLEKGKWDAQWITDEQNLSASIEISNGAQSPAFQNPEKPVMLTIDLGETQNIDSVKLWSAAPPINNVQPGYGFPVRFYLEGSLEADFRQVKVLVDYRNKDYLNPKEKPVVFSFSTTPMRYIRLVTTKQYRVPKGNEMKWNPETRKFYFETDDINDVLTEGRSFRFALNEVEVFSDGNNVAKGKEIDLQPQQEDKRSGWAAEFLTDGRQKFWVDERFAKSKVSLFIKKFTWNGSPGSAYLYISALGLYEARINGQPVTSSVLNPGFSVFDNFVPYRGYDVSKLIKQGENEITVWVGDGWYRKPSWNDRLLMKRRLRGFPNNPARWLIAQLEIVDKEEVKTVGTDGTWQVTYQHPWREANLHFGSKYDGTFNETVKEEFKPATTAEGQKFPELVPDERPPVVIRERVQPVKIWQAGKNRVMIDFGRQLTGAVALTGKVPSVTNLKLTYTEALTTDNEPYLRNQAGRSANGDEYVLLPGTEYHLRPLFTYHGFRYVELTWEGDSSLFDLPFRLKMEALVYSNDLYKTASLHTSDERINRLLQMIDESFRNNLISLITDVAGRDERAFWLGDCFTTPIQSLCYLYDFAAMGRSLFKMMEKSMHEDGIGTVPAPGAIFEFTSYGNHATPGYSDASVIVPNTLSINYNDSYSKLTGWKYADIYTNKTLEANESALPSEIYSTTWIGDWLSNRMTIPPGASSWEPGGEGALPGIFDAYWWNRVLLESANLAMANGDAEKAKHLKSEARQLREAAIAKFAGENGKVEGDEQSSYALLLNLTAPGSTEEEMIFRQLLLSIEDYNNHMATGTLSHLPLLEALSKRGHQDLALEMLMQPHPPSFGYMVDFGSSTIWERLDSRHPRLGINPHNMNGLNHIGQNSVYQWFFENLGGIQVLQEHPGWEKFRVSPLLFKSIEYSTTTLDSPRGKITCRLEKRADEIIQLQLTVPPNSTAKVEFNGWIPESLSTANNDINKIIKEKLLDSNSLPNLEIPSGRYVFWGKLKK